MNIITLSCLNIIIESSNFERLSLLEEPDANDGAADGMKSTIYASRAVMSRAKYRQRDGVDYVISSIYWCWSTSSNYHIYWA